MSSAPKDKDQKAKAQSAEDIMKEIDSVLDKQKENDKKELTKKKDSSSKNEFDPIKILGLPSHSEVGKDPIIPKIGDTKELDDLLKGLNLPETPKLDDLESALKDSLSVPTLEEL